MTHESQPTSHVASAASPRRWAWFLEGRSARGALARVFNPSIGVDPLLWYPCFIYYLWIGYLASLNVRFAAPADETRAYWFILTQSVLIFAAIAVVDGWAAPKAPRPLRLAWISAAYLFFASLYLDAIVYHHTQIHLGRALGILFEDGLSQVSARWTATGVPATALRLYVLGSIAALLLLPGCVWALIRLSGGRPIRVNAWILLSLTAAAWAGSVELKRADARRGWNSRFRDLVAALPLYAGWTPSIRGVKYSDIRLRPPRTWPAAASAGHRASDALPDIFIFFLESTRADCINPDVAPNLARLSKECLPLGGAFSSSNTSHTSWYATLTGNHALYFGAEKRRTRHEGSAPIALLRRLGYKAWYSAAARSITIASM